MDFPAQKFREVVFQILFSFDSSQEQEAELILLLMRELSISKKHVSQAYQRAEIIWRSHAFLDKTIAQLSLEYALERIKIVEKNILRLALYELLIEGVLSKMTVISEACRLARKFGSDEGASFVNAILNSDLTGILYEPSLSPSKGSCAE